MKNLLLTSSLLSAFVVLQAQDFPSSSPQLTSPVINGRFELIQSPLAAKWTFRLDRYTGKIWQLVSTKSDGNSWETMLVWNLPKITTPSHPRFQLFTSGLAARHTFLIDCETGRSWVLSSLTGNNPDGSPNELFYWKQFEE